MLFSMKHVRRDTPNGVYYMPSLCTFISKHIGCIDCWHDWEHGIEPLMFMDNLLGGWIGVLTGLEDGSDNGPDRNPRTQGMELILCHLTSTASMHL